MLSDRTYSRKCKVCSIDFIAKGNQKICSDKCKIESRRKTSHDYYFLFIEKHRNDQNIIRRKLHDDVINFLGGKCANPKFLVPNGCRDKRCLDINHKNYGGNKEYKESSPYRFYKDILSGKRKTDDLEVRCANCNRIYNWQNKKRTTKL